MTETVWMGYRRIDFEFEGMPATVVFADRPVPGGKWLLKTEYFSAFQGFELDMLAQGYHLAHVANKTRWALVADTDRQAAFCAYLAREYAFDPKCLTVGMSCGGLEAVLLAARHPECVAAMALDAPVINLLSCPFHVGSEPDNEICEEFTRVTGLTLKDMISYRDHPLDHFGEIVNIPVYLNCGDSDTSVPYDENGGLMAEYYRAHGGDITVNLVPGRGHHPHFSEHDNGAVIRWAVAHY